MSEDKNIVNIFTVPQEFPCGEGSTCCGPIGQSDEEVDDLKIAITRLGVDVEVHNVKEAEVVKKYPSVFTLLRRFGPGATPIIAVGDEIIGMAFTSTQEAVVAVEGALAGV